MKSNIRLAVVNRPASIGAYAFERTLLSGIKKLRPDWIIDYYCDILPFNHDAETCVFFQSQGIQVVAYPAFAPVFRFRNRFLNGIWNIARYARKIIPTVIRKISGKPTRFSLPGTTWNASPYDAVLYTWPFGIYCPETNFPLFFVPHDINFRFFFGSKGYDFSNAKRMQKEIGSFFQQGHAIVSSDFIKEDILRLFPFAKDKIDVVPLPMMLNDIGVPKQRRKEILDQFGIKYPFFIYPCNLEAHKNIINLAAGVSRCRSRGHDVRLVIVGHGTREIGRSTLDDFHIIRLPEEPENWTIVGLGRVTDEEIKALMQESLAVVTPSLYEAGNGPGLDAWRLGVPVAMSNLPFYTEHLDRNNVRATVFDPLDANSIADALEFVILHPEKIKADAIHSQQSMVDFTPDQLAEGYVQTIERILKAQES